jgi:hypothetical protein
MAPSLVLEVKKAKDSEHLATEVQRFHVYDAYFCLRYSHHYGDGTRQDVAVLQTDIDATHLNR